jgi:hypothetical protein
MHTCSNCTAAAHQECSTFVASSVTSDLPLLACYSCYCHVSSSSNLCGAARCAGADCMPQQQARHHVLQQTCPSSTLECLHGRRILDCSRRNYLSNQLQDLSSGQRDQGNSGEPMQHGGSTLLFALLGLQLILGSNVKKPNGVLILVCATGCALPTTLCPRRCIAKPYMAYMMPWQVKPNCIGKMRLNAIAPRRSRHNQERGI